METWKDIKNYEGLYQVSDLGRIKSKERIDNRNHIRHEMIRKCGKDHYGYNTVNLSKNGKVITKKVHRLVYEAFVGEIPEGMQVNHINEDKTDNRLENLNLLTPKANINWGTGIERRSNSKKGKYNGKLSKPILQYDLDGNFIKEWSSTREINRQLGYSNGNISLSCRGIYKHYKGYIWKSDYSHH